MADNLLRISEIGDWDAALNGLQLENDGSVRKIAAAVDASTRTIEAAIACGADLLVVHHGLFWRGLQPITGGFARQLRLAFHHNLAIYSAHLPLDVHPTLGNNALLAATLGLIDTQPFLEMKGQLAGLRGTSDLPLAQLKAKLEQSLGGPVKLCAHGPADARSVAVVTGGAGSEIYEVAKAGINTFITGEAPHWAAVAAQELGINLLLGGHYATETFGVEALAAHLGERFGLPQEFIDVPTGL